MSKPDRRNDIVQAALALITEKGFHGAPMAMIADRSGVAVGTIYRYFENKDVLINALYQDVEDRVTKELRVGYSTEKPYRERFIHLGAKILRYFIENPLHFRYIEQYHNSPYGTSLRRDRLLENDSGHPDIFTELFTEGVSQQVLKDFPLPVLFSLAFSPLLGLARNHILNFIALDDDLITKVVEACWDGIRR